MKEIILHLFSDEKVVSRVLKVRKEAFPEKENIGLVFTKEKSFRYIKDSENFLIYDDSVFDTLDFARVSCVYIHFLTDDKIKFIRKIPKSIPVCWCVYGGDLYNRYLRYFGFEILYRERKMSLSEVLLYKLVSLVRTFEFRYILKRIRWFCAMSCDYKLIQKYNIKGYESINVSTFSYTMREIMGDLYDAPFCTGDSLVVGNSASYTNNHLYSLKFISKLNLGGYKVVLPLAYGGDSKYIIDIKNYYSNTLHTEVVFNETFVDLHEYNAGLQNAYAFVFGNWRQEALGNIVVALYLGKKVYISTKNPLYEDLKSDGFIIYPLESIEESFSTDISLEDKIHNRELADNLYNKERLLGIMRQNLGNIR